MLKTLDAKLIRGRLQAYWKRFAASATAFAHRYQQDVFLRTEVNIIALQAAYALIIIILSVGAIFVLYREIVSGMAAGITAAFTNAASLDPAAISAGLERARTRDVASMVTLIVCATAMFGYLVARLALTPTRNALSAQKEFIGNVAHEVRTPLAIIKANTEILLIEEKVNKNLRATLTSNIEELDRISDIINNLLTLNALIRPERVPFTSVDIAAVTRRVAEKFSSAALKKQVQIHTQFAGECSVRGNATALEQIVTNLLKNALEHTEDGEITITAGPDAYGGFEFSVRDTGTGIKREDLPRIFEPFYRGDRARTRSGGVGSGLGLAIVHELVKLHKGHVSVRSAPQQGTTVTVTLAKFM